MKLSWMLCPSVYDLRIYCEYTMEDEMEIEWAYMRKG